MPKPGEHVELDTSVGMHQTDISKVITSDAEALVIYSVGGSIKAHAFGYEVTY